MGINIGGRCCGRNIIFDAVTGLNPPLQSCNTLYRFNLEGLFGSSQPSYLIKTPDGVSHNVTNPGVVVTVQNSGYQLLSATSNINSNAISIIYFYGTPADALGWEIFGPGVAFEDLTWGEVETACSTEKCYAYEFNIDEVTYPSASVYAINDPAPDPLSTPLAVIIPLFNYPTFDTELAELIQSLFGGNVSVTSSYDGVTYIIRINNVQSIATTPTFPEFLNLLIDIDPGTGTYDYLEGIETTCL